MNLTILLTVKYCFNKKTHLNHADEIYSSFTYMSCIVFLIIFHAILMK